MNKNEVKVGDRLFAKNIVIAVGGNQILANKWIRNALTSDGMRSK